MEFWMKSWNGQTLEPPLKGIAYHERIYFGVAHLDPVMAIHVMTMDPNMPRPQG